MGFHPNKRFAKRGHKGYVVTGREGNKWTTLHGRPQGPAGALLRVRGGAELGNLCVLVAMENVVT